LTTGPEWAQDGAFLLQHVRGEELDFEPPPTWVANNPLPLVMVFGLDEYSGTFSMLYADARGVSRVYRSTLVAGEWKIWGQAGPEFYQRFTGVISPDGTAITGAWEGSGAHPLLHLHQLALQPVQLGLVERPGQLPCRLIRVLACHGPYSPAIDQPLAWPA